jgi:3-hydroxymyristoyl/3-hydroxydecanoyl-(acyl carrier protein) dehydratase
VTPETKIVTYRIDIKTVSYDGQPSVTADALMEADGQPIVKFTDMGMRLCGVDQNDLHALWDVSPPSSADPVCDRNQLLDFCEGRPSAAFGEPYRIFDDGSRFIARLPRPPYLMMDQVRYAEPRPWVLEPGGWIEAEVAIPRDAWYFGADRSSGVPLCILMEAALQPCGWLAAYMGSALKSDKALHFRNLDGRATLHRAPDCRCGSLVVRSCLTSSSAAGDMIIEHFDFHMSDHRGPVYSGSTSFGFFTSEALTGQAGIRDAAGRAFIQDVPMANPVKKLPRKAPITPGDALPAGTAITGLRLPSAALQMIDTITGYLPDGGTAGKGYIRGAKTVDSGAWFFRAHFYQDPVCPGSLGVDSFVQLLKYVALKRWPELKDTHRFVLLEEVEQEWHYRGQILPDNRNIIVEANITEMADPPHPSLTADGFLQVDGMTIYEIKGFGIRLEAERKPG